MKDSNWTLVLLSLKTRQKKFKKISNKFQKISKLRMSMPKRRSLQTHKTIATQYFMALLLSRREFQKKMILISLVVVLQHRFHHPYRPIEIKKLSSAQQSFIRLVRHKLDYYHKRTLIKAYHNQRLQKLLYRRNKPRSYQLIKAITYLPNQRNRTSK